MDETGSDRRLRRALTALAVAVGVCAAGGAGMARAGLLPMIGMTLTNADKVIAPGTYRVGDAIDPGTYHATSDGTSVITFGIERSTGRYEHIQFEENAWIELRRGDVLHVDSLRNDGSMMLSDARIALATEDGDASPAPEGRARNLYLVGRDVMPGTYEVEYDVEPMADVTDSHADVYAGTGQVGGECERHDLRGGEAVRLDLTDGQVVSLVGCRMSLDPSSVGVGGGDGATRKVPNYDPEDGATMQIPNAEDGGGETRQIPGYRTGGATGGTRGAQAKDA